jgi:hypothetical protein
MVVKIIFFLLILLILIKFPLIFKKKKKREKKKMQDVEMPDNENRNNNNNSSKKGGRRFTSVWGHITRGKEMSHGMYQGTCNYCKTSWSNAKPIILRQHLASHCNKCPEEISSEFARIVAEEDVKKTLDENQSTLEEHYELKKISDGRQKVIDNVLIKAFVCCNLAFNIIENPFFVELLKVLCMGYEPPSRKKLSVNLLQKELACVNIKIQSILEATNNLTLGKYKFYYYYYNIFILTNILL